MIYESPLNCDPALHRPLRVSCALDSAVLSYRDGLNLDGPLQYGAFIEWRLAGGDVADLPSLSGPDAVDFDMPVAKWRGSGDRLLAQNGVWGWHTSDVIAEWAWSEPRAFRGPTPHDKMKRFADGNSVNTSSGAFKPTDLAFPAMWPRDGLLTWYMVGDPPGIAKLLEHVTYIGKKHNLGAGKVRAHLDGTPIWRVEEIEDDHSIRLPDGTLARRMPRGFCDGRPGFGPIRAPNWHRSRYVESVEAGSA